MKPNIIVIMADQLRHDFVGPYTPNLNLLINDSLSFERSYCVSPLCVPSRGAFFTSTYPTSNGCLINPWEVEDEKSGRLKKGIQTFYEIFENDWDLWHTGKQHLLSFQELDQRDNNKAHWLKLEGRYEKELKAKQIPQPGGKEYRQFCPELKNGKFTKIRSYSVPTTGVYPQDLKYFFDGFILNDSLNAIDQRNQEKPFCLSAMFLAPHPPFQIPEPYYSMYKDIKMPENVGRWYSGQSPLQLYQLTGFFGTRYSREQWQEIWRVYAGLVTLFDDCVGKLIAKLKKENLYDDSIIVFTSDHGEMLGSHGLWQKMCLYEESLRVPLSVKLPGNEKAGTKIINAVSHLDVLPTILELVNLQKQAGVQGKSLMRHLQKPQEYEPVFAQFDGNGALGTYQRCMIKGQYKFMFDTIHNEIFFEMYDLQNDKQEMNNIIFTNEALARELGQELCDHLSALKDPIQFTWEYFNQWLLAQKNTATSEFYNLP
jgi:arylsulfatase A-like enzyme